ncbi:MAG: hypothetical protein ACLTDR_03930 [Adlercreutzia equolifaciens]
MAEIVFTEGFMADAAIVEREEKLDEILDTIALLEDAPEIGSAILPASIRRRYGSQVRKLVVRPFDIIYDYLPKDDAVDRSHAHSPARRPLGPKCLAHETSREYEAFAACAYSSLAPIAIRCTCAFRPQSLASFSRISTFDP